MSRQNTGRAYRLSSFQSVVTRRGTVQVSSMDIKVPTEFMTIAFEDDQEPILFKTMLSNSTSSRLNKDPLYNFNIPDKNHKSEFAVIREPTFQQIYISNKANLEIDALDYYFKKDKNEMLEEVYSDSEIENNAEHENIDDDVFERLDSRGKIQKLRKTQFQHGFRFIDHTTGAIVSSFATVNINPNMYLGVKELKMRANSLAYS